MGRGALLALMLPTRIGSIGRPNAHQVCVLGNVRTIKRADWKGTSGDGRSGNRWDNGTVA